VSPDLDRRIEDVVDDRPDLRFVADALSRKRTRILANWLEAAREQPFHRDNPDRAVADHIPALVDAVVQVLYRASAGEAPAAPLEDEDVTKAAEDHARVRFEQGLGPVAVVTEFRLLRHEISRALVETADSGTARDIVAGVAVVDDALDGAATVGLAALSKRIEDLRDEFLATTVHDVRQPITLLTGSLDLASRWIAEPDADRRRIADILGEAVVAVAEINTMLDTLGDATKVAMGAVAPNVEPSSLGRIVAEAIALLDVDARGRIDYEPTDSGRLVGLWDPNYLRRVVINVLGNALKYSPSDDHVDVIIAERRPGLVSLTVRDSGMGLSEAERARVFERFARASRAREAGIPGLGLGLYACRGIVAAHGGDIWVQSDGEGRGTTVIIELPVLRDDEASL
jgi:signal transduction histidine kinase